MSEGMSLREAERQTFRTAFEDGLTDLFLGCVTLGFVLGPFLRLGDFWSSFVFVPFWGAAYLFIRWLKANVVRPRLGVVRFGPFRKTRLTKFSWIAFATCTLAFVLGIFSAVNLDWPGWVHMSQFSLLVLIGFSVAAYFLDLARLYVYGILLALALPFGELLYYQFGVPHHGFPVSFGIPAATMFGVGLTKFLRVLRCSPPPVNESSVAER